MTDVNKDYLGTPSGSEQPLPNGTATLVLGILSIVVCFICGIVALVISNKDVAMYKANPELYSSASYSNIKVGRTCSIIGLCLQIIGIIVYAIFVIFLVTTIGKNGNSFR